MSDKRREQRPGDEPLQEEELLARLYQQTKDEAPSSHLDAAILATARRAAQPSSRRVRFLPSRKWAVPLSLAAALWVTIEIVMMHLNEPRVAMKAKRAQSVSPPAAPKPPAPSAAPQSGGVPEELGRTRGLAPQALREESPVANVEKREAPMAVQPEAPAAPAAQPSAHLLTAPVALDTRLKGDREDASVETELPQLKKERAVSAVSAPGNASDVPEQKSQRRIDVVKDEMLSPKAWVAQINKLRRAGKLSEAEKSLKKFKEKYPEYPVEKFLEQTTTSSP